MISTEAVAGGRSAGSLAWAGLGNTYFWIDPATGVAGIILMQLLPSPTPRRWRSSMLSSARSTRGWPDAAWATYRATNLPCASRCNWLLTISVIPFS